MNLCLLCGSHAIGETELCAAHAPDGLDTTADPPRRAGTRVTWLTLLDVVRETGLNIRAVRRLVRSGRLRAMKQGRAWVVTADALQAYLAARTPAPIPARARRRAWRR